MLPLVTTWMKLKAVMLNELAISQMENVEYCMVLFICGKINKQTKQTHGCR